MLKKVLLIAFLALYVFSTSAQDRRRQWIDSVFNTLSQEAKVGQMFMVSLSTYGQQNEIDEVITLAQNNLIGSVYITNGGPIRHAQLINKLQEVSRVPLLTGISAEWGLAQTLDSTMGFQKPLVASSWKDEALVGEWASEIARQMKILGLNLNFAPNADDEIFRPDFLRYFGNTGERVARSAVAFSDAMRANGIITVAKHLPRRAMVETPLRDSILNLTSIDTVLLHPFNKLFEHHVDGLLTTYLHFSIQHDKGIIPASISQIFISDILRNRLNFEGLIFTDVKSFKNVSRKTRAGEAELLAFETGNDILMDPLNIRQAIKKIVRRLKREKKEKTLQQQLDATVKKILAAKFDAGLFKRPTVNTENLFRRLHDPSAYLLKQRLSENSVTTLVNKDDFLPIKRLEDQSFTCISIGKDSENDFTHYLKKYASFRTLSLKEAKDTIALDVHSSDVIIIGIFPYAKALEKKVASWIDQLALRQKVVVVHFGDPQSMIGHKNSTAWIAAYTDQDNAMQIVPQVVFGGLSSTGILPIYENGQPAPLVETLSLDRLSYSVPEAAGLNSHTLERIKNIVNEAIAMGASPGAYVLVAKDGKVVYEQAAGSLTYDNSAPVTDQTIFDLASLTKVSATLQTIMFLQEKGLIDINKKASVYLPELKNTNKKDITIVDMLTHQSGLVPFMLLWPLTVLDSMYLPLYYNATRNESYPLQVGPELFASRIIRDSVWGWIVKSKMQDKPARTPYAYRYSDLGFMILQRMAETILNQPMEDFLHQNFYEPLGAYTTGFNPLERFPKERIAPTELDKLYRHSLVLGTVHDERAAMMGGVSGHAGLFSTGNDLAKLGQMLLQEGHYGGENYFKPATIQQFSAKQFEGSRRGLGWDKPIPGDWTSPTTRLASPRTFGHTGFTGTCMWIDPEFNLLYIFLSNRVYPDRNNKLLNANIRVRIQEVIYQSIFDYCSNKN